MAQPVRVLVADDSAYMRVILKDMIDSEEGLTVVGVAKDGIETVEKAKELRPDVVLLDIQMPRMDGLATLQRIMKEAPARVVVLSAMDKVDDQLPLKALEMGAVDFISKPSGPVSVDIIKFKTRIGQILRDAAKAKVAVLRSVRTPHPRRLALAPDHAIRKNGMKVILFGASTGGPRALESIFASLPRELPAAMFVVQHLPAEFSKSFAKRLDAANGPEVRVAADGEEIRKGVCYLAPGGSHMEIDLNESHSYVTRLTQDAPVNFVRPSADVLLTSAARCCGSNSLAVILTGMGMDGTHGAMAIKSAGGRVVVQDEASSVIFGMARSVIDSGAADRTLPLEDIPREIIRFLEG
jgi:two-component system chemotaxis response regulator CheB